MARLVDRDASLPHHKPSRVARNSRPAHGMISPMAYKARVSSRRARDRKKLTAIAFDVT